MTREATDNLYIELGYFTPEEYYTYEAYAVAALSSEVTFTCDAEVLGVVEEGVADLTVSVSISADANVTREFDSAFATEFAQVTDAGKIVDAIIDSISLFNPNFDVNAQLAGDALLEVISSLENTISKIAGNASTLESIINLSLQSDRYREFDSAFSTSFTEEIDAARFRDTEVFLAASSSLSCDFVVDRSAISLEVGEFTLAADVDSVTLADAAVSSTATLYFQPDVFIPKVYPNNRPKDLKFFYRNTAGAGTTTYYTHSEWLASEFNEPDTTSTYSNYFNTANKYEGTSSFTFDGRLINGFEINFPSSITVGSSQDFIFEFAVYQTTTVQNGLYATIGNSVTPANETLPSVASIPNGIYVGTTGNQGSMQVIIARTGSPTNPIILNGLTPLLNQWVRFAIRRISGTTLQIVRNTTVIASATYTGSVVLGDVANIFNSEGSGSSQSVSFDNWNLRIGESALSDESTVYTEANTYFRHRFENNFDDATGTTLLLGSETLTSTATITAVPNFTVDGITIHQSSGTLTADVGVIYEDSASLSSEFALAAEGEFVAVEASADLSAEFTQSAEVYRIQEGAATLNAEFAQATDGYRTLEFAIQTDAIFTELAAVARVGAGFITAESYVNLTADVSKTVGFTADLLGVNTLSALVYKTVEGNASISSEASVTADVVKTTDVSSTPNCEFTTATQGDRIRFGDSAITSEFTVAANVSGGFIGADAQLSVLAIQDTSGDRIRFSEAAIESTASISVIADRFAEMPAALSAEFAQAIDYTRTRDASISTDSLFTPVFDVIAQLAGVALLESTASLSATANIIQGQAAELLAQFNANIAAISFKAFDATLNSQAQIVVDGFVGITGDAALASEFAISCDGDVTGVGSSALISVASLITAVPEVLRSVESALSSSANLSATVQVIKTSSAALNAVSSVTANVGQRIGIVANISSAATVTAQGRLIRVEQYVYTIPRESRSWNIKREYRSYSISEENKSYTIRG
jgi:hypothetical protein